MVERTYIAIDLKSFYASSECVELGFDPLRTHLVVADESRTDKTICLAVSPSLKAYGLPGRARLFEVREKLRQINAERATARARRSAIPRHIVLRRRSWKPIRAWRLDVYIAKPRMSHYSGNASAKNIRHLPEVRLRGRYPRLLRRRGVHGRHAATCAPTEKPRTRLARDIVRAISTTRPASPPPRASARTCTWPKWPWTSWPNTFPAGPRTACASPGSTRCRTVEIALWNHRPLTDFWRVGRGYAKEARSARAGDHGGYRPLLHSAVPTNTTTRICCTRLFGVNAELLIDHAWGWEPCTIADIKVYKPAGHSCEFRTSADQVPAGFGTQPG